MVPEGLASLVDEFGIAVAIVASVDDGAVVMIGQSTALEYDDLAEQLFGDAGRIAELNRSLEGQILPQMWSQGSVSCVVCKPDPHSIVGFIYHETRSVVEQYRWSKAVNDRVEALWGQPA